MLGPTATGAFLQIWDLELQLRLPQRRQITPHLPKPTRAADLDMGWTWVTCQRGTAPHGVVSQDHCNWHCHCHYRYSEGVVAWCAHGAAPF